MSAKKRSFRKQPSKLLTRLTRKLREADARPLRGVPDYQELAQIAIKEVRRALKEAARSPR